MIGKANLHEKQHRQIAPKTTKNNCIGGSFLHPRQLAPKATCTQGNLHPMQVVSTFTQGNRGKFASYLQMRQIAPRQIVLKIAPKATCFQNWGKLQPSCNKNKLQREQFSSNFQAPKATWVQFGSKLQAPKQLASDLCTQGNIHTMHP